MAIVDNEAEERWIAVRQFFQDNGRIVSVALLVAALALVAVWWWRWHETQQSQEAGKLYVELVKKTMQDDVGSIKALSGELAAKYGDTGYATLGLLISSRALAERKDYADARSQLTRVMEKGASPEFRDLARLHLAYVLAEEKSYDEALAKLSPAPVAGLTDSFEEFRGDIYLAQGKRAEAKMAYQSALDKLVGKDDLHDEQRKILRTKLNGLSLAS